MSDLTLFTLLDYTNKSTRIRLRDVEKSRITISDVRELSETQDERLKSFWDYVIDYNLEYIKPGIEYDSNHNSFDLVIDAYLNESTIDFAWGDVTE